MNKTISRKEVEDLSWLAGIIDGEGTFYLSTNVSAKDSRLIYTQIRIPNVDMTLIAKASEILSEHHLKYYYNRKPSDNGHDVLTICMKSRKCCQKAIRLLLPYLWNKKSQALAMSNVLEYIGQKRGAGYLEDKEFLRLMAIYQKEKKHYIDPINISRKANKALTGMDAYGDVSECDLSYLAGILDGEGYITATEKDTKGKRYCFPIIEVANTDYRMIGRISQIFEGLNLRFHYTYSRKDKRNTNHKNVLYIRITAQGSAYKLLSLLMPFFTAKKKMARATANVIGFIKTRRSRKVPGLYTDDKEYKVLSNVLKTDKYMYFDPQRLICVANTPLCIG